MGTVVRQHKGMGKIFPRLDNEHDYCFVKSKSTQPVFVSTLHLHAELKLTKLALLAPSLVPLFLPSSCCCGVCHSPTTLTAMVCNCMTCNGASHKQYKPPTAVVSWSHAIPAVVTILQSVTSQKRKVPRCYIFGCP